MITVTGDIIYNLKIYGMELADDIVVYRLSEAAPFIILLNAETARKNRNDINYGTYNYKFYNNHD